MLCRPKVIGRSRSSASGIALVAFFIVAFTDYRRLIDSAPVFYVIGLVLLLLVLTPLGVTVNGQKAWVRLPLDRSVSAVGVCKDTRPFSCSRSILAHEKRGILKLKEMLIGVAIFAGPVGLIMLEPDAGQAITYFPMLAAMFFLSGIKVRYVILAAVAAAILIPAAWYVGVETGKIKRYQQERILAITNPDQVDPRGYGYHTIQSTITVGKGGLAGISGRHRNVAERP